MNQPVADLVIRGFRDDDRSGLVALWERSDLVNRWSDPEHDIDLALKSAETEIFVAELDGSIVASLIAGYDGNSGWLHYLAVDPEHRERGYGRRMLEHGESQLLARGAISVQSMVPPEARGALSFLARCGYQPNPCRVMQRWLIDRGAPRLGSGGDGRLDIVITYLEMHERPPLQVVHPPSDVQVALLRANEPPVEFYRFLYNHVGERWLWWERRVLGDEVLTEVIHDENRVIYVLYVDGVPAGFSELNLADKSDIEVAYFGLMPAFMRRGLGRYLLYCTLEIAWDHDPDRVWVHTNTLDDPRALPLYQRMGFVPYKQEHRKIIDPRLTGLIPAS